MDKLDQNSRMLTVVGAERSEKGSSLCLKFSIIKSFKNSPDIGTISSNALASSVSDLSLHQSDQH